MMLFCRLTQKARMLEGPLDHSETAVMVAARTGHEEMVHLVGRLITDDWLHSDAEVRQDSSLSLTVDPSQLQSSVLQPTAQIMALVTTRAWSCRM